MLIDLSPTFVESSSEIIDLFFIFISFFFFQETVVTIYNHCLRVLVSFRFTIYSAVALTKIQVPGHVVLSVVCCVVGSTWIINPCSLLAVRSYEIIDVGCISYVSYNRIMDLNPHFAGAPGFPRPVGGG